MQISVVIPIYNEIENLEDLFSRVWKVLRTRPVNSELIVVDDGSTDGSAQLLDSLVQKYPSSRAVHLTKNFGQTAAMAAGFHEAKAEVVVALDGDLQNEPEDIWTVYDKLQDGFDVVSGWRAKRKDHMVLRKFPSLIANNLISQVTGCYLHDYGCSLKAYRRIFLDRIQMVGEMHRFLPALLAIEGARVTEVPVRHHPRTRGTSKYGLGRTIKVVLDLFTVSFLGKFRHRPAYLFGSLGLLLCMGGVFTAGVVIYDRLHGGIFAHRNPLLQLAVFMFIMGVQLLLSGLTMEVITRQGVTRDAAYRVRRIERS